MQKLVRGIHDFQNGVFKSQRQLFERLADGQQPLALFITCSDSRINPNLLTQTEPGELFILRNVGNIVPAYGALYGGEAATIEYAVSVLKVRDIVICGHSHCGAMGALIDPPSTADLPAVRAWLQHAAATQRIIRENYAEVEDPQARRTLAVEENVLVQIENLRTHPVVAAGVGREELGLHGWVYKFETGQVFAYDWQQGQFLPLAEPAAPIRRAGSAAPMI